MNKRTFEVAVIFTVEATSFEDAEEAVLQQLQTLRRTGSSTRAKLPSEEYDDYNNRVVYLTDKTGRPVD